MGCPVPVLQHKVEAEERAREKAIQVAEAVGECYQIERTNMVRRLSTVCARESCNLACNPCEGVQGS